MQSNKLIDDVIQVLKQNIEEGTYGIGGTFPSQRKLANQLDVSGETVNKAIQALQATGHVISQNGYVIANPKRFRMEGVTLGFDTFLEANGLTPEFQNVGTPEIIELNEDYAKEFHLPVGTKVVKRVRLQGERRDIHPILSNETTLKKREKATKKGTASRTREPIIIWYRLAETFYLYDFLKGIGGESWIDELKENPRLNVTQEIKKKTGKELAWYDASLAQDYPTLEQRKLLKITSATPVLDMWRVCKDNEKDGTILMLNHLIMVGYAFKFHFSGPIKFS